MPAPQAAAVAAAVVGGQFRLVPLEALVALVPLVPLMDEAQPRHRPLLLRLLRPRPRQLGPLLRLGRLRQRLAAPLRRRLSAVQGQAAASGGGPVFGSFPIAYKVQLSMDGEKLGCTCGAGHRLAGDHHRDVPPGASQVRQGDADGIGGECARMVTS